MFKKLIKSVRANILVGLFLTVPVAATIIIFNFFFKLATDWLVNKKIFENIFGSGVQKFALRLITIAIIIVAFYLVGLLVRNFFGKRLYQFGDKLLTRIPVIKGIYTSVRQISESLFTQRKTLFKEVVLVEYPRKGLYSLAFITANAPASVAKHMKHGKNEECISLFISTTPNPTSGVFILVPKSEVIPLNIPVTDALTFIMSAGAVAPGEEGDDHPTLLDKLETWFKHGDNIKTEKLDASETTT
ncbi:DUF502 domain-containing protein [Verrucomicrobiota bacterium]